MSFLNLSLELPEVLWMCLDQAMAGRSSTPAMDERHHFFTFDMEYTSDDTKDQAH